MGQIITISGPRGVGKTSIIEGLSEHGITPLVPYTTRPPRIGEINNVDYHFVSHSDFEDLKAQSPMFDTIEVNGNHYGTPISNIDEALESEKVRTFNVAGETALKLRKYGGALVRSVMILPSEKDDIYRQMRDAGISKSSIKDRIDNEPNDLSLLPKFDYTLTNQLGHLDQTVDMLLGYIRSLS